MAETIELKVDGMTCDHCVRAVTDAITGVDGVTEASVDLDAGAATVRGKGVDLGAVVAAVIEEGYEAAPQAAS
ncbi:MAG: heavy-metal-associated domain-containing protein [Dehalococcoidia bacterium]|nr:heavy-metal-associated domain-containing protein [Dehalococcoidia bacterium]MYD28468.1 heavy-metal-associated domain-containing protein [Dehalococcoidia bacterium]